MYVEISKKIIHIKKINVSITHRSYYLFSGYFNQKRTQYYSDNELLENVVYTDKIRRQSKCQEGASVRFVLARGICMTWPDRRRKTE